MPLVDPWLLAVLNSPAGWWFAFRTAQHGKDEALRYFTTFLESFPIPQPKSDALDSCQTLVDELINSSHKQQTVGQEMLDWLRVQHGISDPNNKLKDPISLDSDAFVTEIQKARSNKNSLTAAGLRSLREEYSRTIEPARFLAAEALQLEYRLHDLVNAAYGLTPEEVGLMWDTAPPRMPIPRPNPS